MISVLFTRHVIWTPHRYKLHTGFWSTLSTHNICLTSWWWSDTFKLQESPRDRRFTAKSSRSCLVTFHTRSHLFHVPGNRFNLSRTGQPRPATIYDPWLARRTEPQNFSAAQFRWFEGAKIRARENSLAMPPRSTTPALTQEEYIEDEVLEPSWKRDLPDADMHSLTAKSLSRRGEHWQDTADVLTTSLSSSLGISCSTCAPTVSRHRDQVHREGPYPRIRLRILCPQPQHSPRHGILCKECHAWCNILALHNAHIHAHLSKPHHSECSRPQASSLHQSNHMGGCDAYVQRRKGKDQTTDGGDHRELSGPRLVRKGQEQGQGEQCDHDTCRHQKIQMI